MPERTWTITYLQAQADRLRAESREEEDAHERGYLLGKAHGIEQALREIKSLPS